MSRSRRSFDLDDRKQALLDALLAEAGVAGPARETIPRLPAGAAPPLSFGQERLWFLDRMAPQSPVYNVPCGLRLVGALDVRALERALGEVARRHEVLRTTFRSVGGRPVPVVAPPPGVTLPVTDLSAEAGDDRAAAALRYFASEVRQPFDLGRGPLWRASLVRLAEDDHALLLTMHHIVCDIWSVGVLKHELGALYTAYAGMMPPRLAEPPIQYADFAAWQRQRLAGDLLAAEVAHWRRQLDGAPPALDLPADRPRPAVQTFAGAHFATGLPADLAAALGALSRREAVTLYMTLLAAFVALLARLTGQEDVVVGAPIANRARVEVEGLIGFFVNTLVLRTGLGGDPTFREILARVREVTLDAYAHQDLPFEKLVDALSPERDLGRAPLCQVLFTFQNVPPQPAEFLGLDASDLEAGSGTSKFDLTLFMWEKAGRLEAVFEYNTDLFNASTVGRLAGCFRTLLSGVVADPGRRLADLPLIDAGERRRLLFDWNATAAAYPADLGIHELFAAQARRTPGDAAVTSGGRSLSYGELDRRSARLARALRRLGVGPDVPVGVLAERSPEMVIALLGVLRAGGAYVPLDPSHPTQRLAFMLDDSGAPVLLTQERLLAGLPPYRGRVHVLDAAGDGGDGEGGAAGDGGDDEGAGEARGGAGPPAAAPDNLAYIIYTSGSTGVPKGVANTHRGVVNMLWSMRRQPGLDPRDVLLAVTSISFDIAALELLLPLVVGATVVVAGRDDARDGRRLAGLLASCGATVMQATPATWRMLLDSGWRGDGRIKVLCGGETLPRALAVDLARSAAEVWNVYGPTETTVWSLVHRVQDGPGPVPVGRPIANTRVHVLDRRLEPLPAGAYGEIYIGGDGVARGYHGRADLTAERFVPDPWGGVPGARLYRTGDIGRYLEDGAVDFRGRADLQVKIRGFRIEPGEIEAALGRQPGVRQAAVVAREDAPGEKRLVAYVVPRPGATLTLGELGGSLRAHLPEHMVPSAFVVLDDLPLTPGGKVDRRALPAPEARALRPDAAFAEPQTEIEQVVARIWREVLRRDRVGLDDNFFDLGGHSLLLIQVSARLTEAFGREIPVVDMFRHTTVSALAAYLAQAGRDDAPAADDIPSPRPGAGRAGGGRESAGGGRERARRLREARLGHRAPPGMPGQGRGTEGEAHGK